MVYAFIILMLGLFIMMVLISIQSDKEEEYYRCFLKRRRYHDDITFQSGCSGIENKMCRHCPYNNKKRRRIIK